MKKRVYIVIIVVFLIIMSLFVLFLLRKPMNSNFTDHSDKNDNISENKDNNLKKTDYNSKKILAEYEQKLQKEYTNINDLLTIYMTFREANDDSEADLTSIYEGSIKSNSDTVLIDYVEIRIIQKDGKLVDLIRLTDPIEVSSNDFTPLFYGMYCDYSDEYIATINFYKHNK